MKPCCRATIESLRTGSQVAEELGVHRTYVWALRVAHDLGILVGGFRMYTPADIETMRGKLKR